MNCIICELSLKLGGVGILDLLCGGPPCQEYSRSQDRRSQKVETKDVPTSYLFQEMIRVINILQPKVFLFENVEGLLTAKWRKKKGRKGKERNKATGFSVLLSLSLSISVCVWC